MNNEGDYLWDKTGEPDPEVQQLEEILGALRYQPKPLEIPADLQIAPPRNLFRGYAPGLAIAATIAMILVGLALWVGLQRLQRGTSEVSQTSSKPESNANPNPATVPSPSKDHDASALVSSSPEPKQIDSPRRHRVIPSLVAENTNRSATRKGTVKNLPNDSALAANDLQAGTAAKDQLLLGLRVACAKLNLAQKKTQESTNPRDLIHNQHKIG